MPIILNLYAAWLGLGLTILAISTNHLGWALFYIILCLSNLFIYNLAKEIKK